VGKQGVDVTKQLKVSDSVYDDLDELKDEEGHTSFDSVLRTLLLHYRHVQPTESEE
jgi:predicted CopG family antitoxin